jgi:sulfoxide reductase heme-binding subunit YedZ
MTDGPLLWYVNRGTGVVLLVLLTVSVVLGVLASRGRAGGRVPQFVRQDLHRNVSLLAVALLAAHVASAVLDTFVDIRWWSAFVPVRGGYDPVWLGLGTLSLDLLVVVVLTSLARARMPYRSWWLVHLLSYVAWALGVAHGIGIGTDETSDVGWGLPLTIGCVAAVALAVVVRLAQGAASARRRTSRDVAA